MTRHDFGKGRAAYLSGFTYSPAAARMLLDLLLTLTGTDGAAAAICDHPLAEAAYYPADRALAVLNNSDQPLTTAVSCPGGRIEVTLDPLETRIQKL